MKNQPQQSVATDTARETDELFFPTLMAWFVPGAGHWMLGMRRKAVVYFLCVVGLFFGGVILGNYTVVSFKYHPYAFLLHLCTGAPAMVTTLFTNAMENVGNPTRWGDIGTTMTWVAGALNVLLVADALDRANGGPYETEKKKKKLGWQVLKRLWNKKS